VIEKLSIAQPKTQDLFLSQKVNQKRKIPALDCATKGISSDTLFQFQTFTGDAPPNVETCLTKSSRQPAPYLFQFLGSTTSLYPIERPL